MNGALFTGYRWIVDYLKGYTPTAALIQELHRSGELLCVCDVVIAEVYAGLTSEDRVKAHQLLDACPFLLTGPEAARQAGEWRYTYARRGISLSLPDALIAATAYMHGASVVTANATDYPMDEVSVLTLPRPNR